MHKNFAHNLRDKKTSIYDLLCTTDDGSRVIVELQKRKQDSYAERMLYYSMHQVLQQVEAGASSFDFCPIYVISILNFTIDQNNGLDNVKTVYRLMEEKSRALLTDRLTYIFIELPKFVKTAEELDGDVLEGMYFCLKNMSKLQERPDVLKHGVFDTIFRIGELLEMDEVTRDKILENMTTERDLKNQFDYVRKEGFAIGRAEGHAEGDLARAMKVAKEMLADGMPVDKISKYTELTAEQIETLMA